MYGIIDVGGGMRGIYGAGVVDYCLDNDIYFDHCIGISAGSANLANYISGQRGRTLKFYSEYAFRKEYMGFSNMVKTGYFVNLKYIYGTLSNSDGEYPLDYPAIVASDQTFTVVATDAETGLPVYYTKDDIHQDDYGAIMGSSCVPAIDRPYPFQGRKLFDGGMSDPIPIEKAFQEGCDKVVLVLTRPREFRRESKKDERIARTFSLLYPKAAKALTMRARLYNYELDLCEKYAAEGRVLILAPDDIGGMDTLTKDKETMLTMYEKGYNDAEMILDFLR